MHKPPRKKPKINSSSSSQINVVKLGAQPPDPSPRFDPFTAFKTPESSWNSTPEIPLSGVHNKGKTKANPELPTFGSRSGNKDDIPAADKMWVDMYEPTAEAELAVHKRKVEDVRRWLSEAFYSSSATVLKYRRLLVLTGPAGAGKTTTLRVLAKEMGFRIMEWKSMPTEITRSKYDDFDGYTEGSNSYSSDADFDTPFSNFEAFLSRAASYQDLFTPNVSNHTTFSQIPSSAVLNRHVILLEDLPNVLHPGTQAQFHAALQAFATSPVSSPPVPMVIVISDAGIKGEANDYWERRNDGIIDIRTVLPKTLLGGPYVTQIAFNPVAPTLLLKALQALMNTRFTRHSEVPLSREILEAIIQSANGDVRSAIMTAQFSCISRKNGKSKKNKEWKASVLESTARREQSLVLFHLLGKIFYNRRKGDPPSSTASAKDIQKEKALEAQIKDPPKLPHGFQEHERRASRIDVDVLYADSPIDSSLLSLYIHQNYIQFCDTLEHCDGTSDWLSWVDSSGGDTWHQANPHRFHLLTLGTLHSLPSPVIRRSQKIRKPAFFEYLDKEKKAREAVKDVYEWLSHESNPDQHNGWSHAEVALEMSCVLKARDTADDGPFARLPQSHRLFSDLLSSPGTSYGASQALDEKEIVSPLSDTQDDVPTPLIRKDMKSDGGWLENDDIEEF